MTDLSDKTVLIVATDGFENSELFDVKAKLEAAGATCALASLSTEDITGESGGEKADSITPDLLVSAADEEDYDALMLPGGVSNPDSLRTDDDVVALIQAFDEAGKPIAAICHAPWLLIEADIVEGRTVTSWPSVRTDLENAGGEVVDQAVAVDENLITSRNPDDIPAFADKLIEMLAE